VKGENGSIGSSWIGTHRDKICTFDLEEEEEKNRSYLHGHIVVVELVVAKRDINVQSLAQDKRSRPSH
jgi:hypothetical protein